MGQWQTIYCNMSNSPRTKAERVRNDRITNNAIKTVKSLKLDEMKKHGDELYDIKVLHENALLDAYKEKRLKSKNLIKQAKKLIKKRAEAQPTDLEMKVEAESESTPA